MSHEKLTMDELKFVQKEIDIKGKNIKTAYILAALLGFMGIHRVYLGKKKSGIARALLSVLTLVSFGAIFKTVQLNSTEAYNTGLAITFISLIAISLIWWAVDLFLISRWIIEMNVKVEEKAIEKARQSRYVEENLMRTNITDELVSEITDKVRESVYEELKKKVKMEN